MELFCILIGVIDISIELNTQAHMHAHTQKYKWNHEILNKIQDCIYISVPFAILDYSFTRCYQWGKLDQGSVASLCVISHAFI